MYKTYTKPTRILNAKNTILGLKKFDMRQEASEDQKYFSNVNRFNWKWNFSAQKRNEQRIYSPRQILNAKNAILGLKRFDMRQEASEDQKYLSNVNRFNWKCNFGAQKRNEQRIYSPVQILNAKNAILGLKKF